MNYKNLFQPAGITNVGLIGTGAMISRPYHLLGIETAMSVLTTNHLKLSTGGADLKPRVDVGSRTSRTLGQGYRLSLEHDHSIMKVIPEILPTGTMASDSPIPYYMAAGNSLKYTVEEGRLLTFGTIDQDPQSCLWKLRREQDAIFGLKFFKQANSSYGTTYIRYKSKVYLTTELSTQILFKMLFLSVLSEPSGEHSRFFFDQTGHFSGRRLQWQLKPPVLRNMWSEMPLFKIKIQSIEETKEVTTTMAVFITGGHGHIGSWAAYFLAKEGEQIILFDTNPMVPDHLGEVSKNITFVKGDVREELGFEPEYSVEEGVQKYARWIENKLK